MRKLINKLSGSEMWVADNRVDEYIAAGHKPAAVESPVKPAEDEPEQDVIVKPEKEPVRKNPAKRRGKR